MATMDLRRQGAAAYEFEDTRPTLYFSQHTWAHLNAVRRLSRSAANDEAAPAAERVEPASAEPAAAAVVQGDPPAEPPPIRDFTTAAWLDDDQALGYVAVVPERRRIVPGPATSAALARLALGAVLAVTALAMVTQLVA